MAENYRVGPSYLFYGNFLDDGGGSPTDVIYLGRTRGDVTIAPNVQIARGILDQTGQAPHAQAIWFGGYAPVATLPLADEDKTRMTRIMPGGTEVVSGSKATITFDTLPQKVLNANIGTLCILPVKDTYDTAEPFNSPDAWWLPAAITTEFGELIFGEIAEGDDVINPHEVQMTGLYRKTLQDDATTIPDAYRVIWRGTPDPDGTGISEFSFPVLADAIDS